MELHNLIPAAGATKSKKVRLGRGVGSGKGRTSARGHKGAKSRSGYSQKQGFEGGQMPLQRRIPKRGFKSLNKINYVVFNLDDLLAISEKYNTTDINPQFLIENKIITKKDKIKILARGEVSKGFNVTANAVSKSAEEAIKNNGGSVSIL